MVLRINESNFSQDRIIHVYEGQDNYQNYVFVRDFNRGDDDTIIVDWDLSDEEVHDLARRILSGEFNLDDSYSTDGWESWDSVTSGMNEFHSVDV